MSHQKVVLVTIAISVAVIMLVGCPQATGGDDGSNLETTLADRLSLTTVTVPNGVSAGVTSWRIWGVGSFEIAPVFTVPLANCETLVGYTGVDGNARAVRLSKDDTLVTTYELATGRELRGLAAEPDGHFAALLWDDANDRIYLDRFTGSGVLDWSNEIAVTDVAPDDFQIGDSRLEYGSGSYGAYYHVIGTGGLYAGHDGETLYYTTTAGIATVGGFSWGASHSMSALLRYSPGVGEFLPIAVTDCYPGTVDAGLTPIGGIYISPGSGANKVIDVCANCGGKVAGELGSAAPSPSGWAVVFASHRNAATAGPSSYNPVTMNQDVGMVRIGWTGVTYDPGSVVWLTNTDAVDETDATAALWEPEGQSVEQYLVGWAEPDVAYTYRLARVNSEGSILEGPIDISPTVAWGRRDDPMRVHANKDVVWAWFDSAGSTTLHFARVVSGRDASCGP